MPLPMIFAAAARMAPGLLRGLPIRAKRRRHRKKRITQGELMELNHIKNILGKTAAANALPFYLGRGS